LLHGGTFDQLILGTVPSDGAVGHVRDAASIESRVSVIFASRQRSEAVTADRFRLDGASSGAVPVEVDLFYGTDSHVVHLIPQRDLGVDEEYRVTVDGNFTFTFSTRAPPVVEPEAEGCRCAGRRGNLLSLALLLPYIGLCGARRLGLFRSADLAGRARRGDRAAQALPAPLGHTARDARDVAAPVGDHPGV
jgi:hypothetical protein